MERIEIIIVNLTSLAALNAEGIVKDSGQTIQAEIQLKNITFLQIMLACGERL